MRILDPADTVDVACVIHGTGYEWIYVDRLYDMVKFNTTRNFRFHVYTEESRPVPTHMIKHSLIDWPGVSGPKRSWWYKMQLFDPANNHGPLLYLDLDLIITKNIDWIWKLDLEYFWAVNDFRRIFRPGRQDINSSVMYWNRDRHSALIWHQFNTRNFSTILRKYKGDQEFLNDIIDQSDLRFFDVNKIKSYRWEIKDGGLNPKKRTYYMPNTGSHLETDTSLVVFHGTPKPHEINDFILKGFWEYKGG